MSLSSGGLAQFSAGAGRSYMIFWPPASDSPNNGSGSSGLTGRGGVSQVSNGVSFSLAGTATMQWQGYIPGNPGSIPASDTTRGQPVMQLKTLANGDSARFFFNQGPNYIEVDQLAAGMQPDRFFRVFRFVVRVNFPLLAAPISKTAVDIGISLTPGNVASMNSGANRAGIEFGPTDVGVMTLRSRKNFGAAYDFNQDFTYAALGMNAANGDTGFVTYEFRVISADNTGAAQLKCFCNEIQVGPTFRVSAADGRVPGTLAAGGGFNNMIASVINNFPGVYALQMKYAALIFAPDEQGNL